MNRCLTRSEWSGVVVAVGVLSLIGCTNVEQGGRIWPDAGGPPSEYIHGTTDDSSDPTATPADAGVAEGTPDAGGVVEDAGAPMADAGVGLDAGLVVDAGAMLDAGTTLDAGVTPDAGMTLDAGATLDAGTGLDGGADAGFLDGGLTAVTDGGLFLDGGLASADGGSGPLVYVGTRTQSPIDAALAQRLRALAGRGSGRAGVFAKVGDSISTSASGVGGGQFLNCLDGAMEGTQSWDINVHLGAFSGLRDTIEFFKQTRLGTDDSWSRASASTRVGAFAHWALNGSPSPLEQELTAINPRFAVVMFGSNDIGYFGPSPYPLANQLEVYEGQMRAITDQLISRGVIPVLTTMPPDLDPRWARFTPAYSAVVRAIAQGRQVPLIDYQRELRALGTPYGLGSDGTHPTCAAWNGCCWFDPSSLTHGYNVRNLITLQAFDRLRQVFANDAVSLDPGAERLRGDGSAGSPFVIGSLPFGELRSLQGVTSQASGSLSCPGLNTIPPSGPQVLYRFTADHVMSVRVAVLDDGAAAHRVSVLSAPTGGACIAGGTRVVTADLQPGSWYFAVNTRGGTVGREFNLSITECLPGDPDC